MPDDQMSQPDARVSGVSCARIGRSNQSFQRPEPFSFQQVRPLQRPPGRAWPPSYPFKGKGPAMHSIIYLVGLVVVILFILSVVGLA